MKHGIVLVKKEENMTSYDVIRILKKKFKTNKIGHAGTLDPFASGLLIIGINEGTKILPYIENEYKEYIGLLELGKLTDSYDRDGKVINTNIPKKHTKDEIRAVLESFIGVYKQTPPKYSAIKLNGKPLYKYAREGKEVNIAERTQHIFDMRLINYEDDKIYFYVKCDKGTYIRVLGVDIARKLNEIGYLKNLERIGIGKHKILNVPKVNNISEDNVIPIKKALNMKCYDIEDESKIKNGLPIKTNNIGQHILVTNKDKALAIYEYSNVDMMYHCKRGFYYENN